MVTAAVWGVLWPSKYAKMRFRPGLRPGPAGEAYNAAPDPHIPPHSALFAFGARHSVPLVPRLLPLPQIFSSGTAPGADLVTLTLYPLTL